jgi:nitroimidazol reductase NimA-like FMN-containing flavoprotein (pyridoxamine 5'-phosphate oxidase superfamily)
MKNKMAHFINPYNRVVVQKIKGEDVDPREWEEMTDAGRAEFINETEASFARFTRLVMNERRMAEARGVHIILDETRPQHFTRVLIED